MKPLARMEAKRQRVMAERAATTAAGKGAPRCRGQREGTGREQGGREQGGREQGGREQGGREGDREIIEG